jgi:hypothetical protein
MAATVITGGTDGIGRALADTYLDRGHNVLVVGTSSEKGKRFLEAAASRGAGDRAQFLRADLSLVAENNRTIDWIAERYPAIDVLVLGARYHRSTRVETADGFESNFALFYLSRFLLSHGLVSVLRRAEHATVLNFGGSGLTGPVRWDDLQLRRNYPGTGATSSASTSPRFTPRPVSVTCSIIPGLSPPASRASTTPPPRRMSTGYGYRANRSPRPSRRLSPSLTLHRHGLPQCLRAGRSPPTAPRSTPGTPRACTSSPRSSCLPCQPMLAYEPGEFGSRDLGLRARSRRAVGG